MNASKQEFVIREPSVAGQFYPGNAADLRDELRSLFNDAALKVNRQNTIAVIAPHAGYVYSGSTAANSFIQVDPDKEYENIFVIGSSHTTSFDGASIYATGHFKTPLGIVPVNLELAKELVNNHSCFTSRPDAHAYEHSLEVQLPFLQYYLRKPFKIIPIVIATNRQATCQKIAEALRPYLNRSNLFVISTDFSHYPDYNDAVRVDKLTAESIITNKPEVFLTTISGNENSGIHNLATSICGWTSVLTLLHMTSDMEGITYVPIAYRNSGDAPYYGDKSRVVGYYSIVVTRNSSGENVAAEDETYNLSEDDRSTLLDIARKTIESYIHTGNIPGIETSGFSDNLMKPTGAFVTIHRNNELRGCIGRFNPDIPLYKVIQDMAIAAAVDDYRFSPVKASELSGLSIEISVLTPLHRIHSADDIVLGKHGIYIKKGQKSGTFLPQVATGSGWTTEEFLGYCARDKAGIGWSGWKDAEIYTYEALVFEEH
ncbi:MAG: AmmeMemoRadiSam system protein B [Bacteroidales bacterium]|nr:AmmeMemoRadiSam system protein B [Bacteroidales bacterium]